MTGVGLWPAPKASAGAAMPSGSRYGATGRLREFPGNLGNIR
jgi:hypothetical protein